MGGAISRTHGADGIYDDLLVKVLMIEANEPLVLIAVDVLGFTRAQISAIKLAIHESCGLEPRQVLINSTHTHAGPMLHNVFYSDMRPSEKYMTDTVSTIVEAVTDAAANLNFANLSFGLGPTDIGISRHNPGLKPMFRPSDAPIDNEVFVLRVDSDAFQAIAFGTGCHPTVLRSDDYKISAEFPGAACQALERDIGDAGIAMFFQGAGGDVKARRVADLEAQRFIPGSYEIAQQVGRDLANDVLNVMNGDMHPITGPIQIELTDVSLPFDLPDDLESHYGQIMADQGVPSYYRHWAKKQSDLLSRGQVKRSYDEVLHTVRFEGSGTTLLAYSDELCSGHAIAVKRKLADRLVAVLGYSNGLDIYIPTDLMLRTGGYEAYDSVYSMLETPGPFAAGIDERLLDAVQGRCQMRLMGSLFRSTIVNR